MAMYASSPFSSADLVFGPNTPSIFKPARFWNSLIANFVKVPFIPSISPWYIYKFFNWIWASLILVTTAIGNVVVVDVGIVVVVDVGIVVVVGISLEIVVEGVIVIFEVIFTGTS